MSTNNKYHERRRLQEAQQAAALRHNPLALLPGTWAAFNYDDISRIRNIVKLPQGAPLVIQEDPNNPTAFTYLPGVDGPVDPSTQK